MTLVPNYVPTDWVDTVTPVDEAHMDKLDVAVDQHADAINALDTRVTTVEGRPVVPAVVNGQWIKGSGGAMVWSAITQADVSGLSAALTAKQDASAKGQANGYASLDSGGKVPTTQLPVSIDLRWAGTYVPATAYKEGDVVIYNGVSYMALRPSTGETPAPWSTGAASGLTSGETMLSADVTLTTSMQDILTVSLQAGTYLAYGICGLTRGGSGSPKGTAIFKVGATTLVSAETDTLLTTQVWALPLVAVFTLAAADTLRMQALANTTGGAPVAAAAVKTSPQGANATKIAWVKTA